MLFWTRAFAAPIRAQRFSYRPLEGCPVCPKLLVFVKGKALQISDDSSKSETKKKSCHLIQVFGLPFIDPSPEFRYARSAPTRLDQQFCCNEASKNGSKHKKNNKMRKNKKSPAHDPKQDAFKAHQKKDSVQLALSIFACKTKAKRCNKPRCIFWASALDLSKGPKKWLLLLFHFHLFHLFFHVLTMLFRCVSICRQSFSSFVQCVAPFFPICFHVLNTVLFVSNSFSTFSQFFGLPVINFGIPSTRARLRQPTHPPSVTTRCVEPLPRGSKIRSQT